MNDTNEQVLAELRQIRRLLTDALPPEADALPAQAPCQGPPHGSAPEGAVGLLMIVYPDGRATLDVRRGRRVDSLFNFAPLDEVLRKAWPTALAETREYLGLPASGADQPAQPAATTR